MKLSAVIIARNEAPRIGGALDAIRKGVDEIVVYDTGSTDDTCDVARKHGADVVVSDPSLLVEVDGYTTLGDFAAARNRALELAHGDAAFIVDADHRLVWPTLDVARGALQREPDVCAWTVWYHIASRVDAKPTDVVAGKRRLGKPFGCISVIRLLGGPYYEGVIHETTEAWLGRQGERGHKRGNLERSRVADYGHEPDERKRLGKDRRNLLLLERACTLYSDDPVPWTYWAMELMSRDDPRAAEVCDAGWRLLGDPRLIGSHLLRLVIARCWTRLRARDIEGAWSCIREWDARDGSEHPDVLTMRGLCAEVVGMREHAITMYRAARAPGQTWAVRHIVSDTAGERLAALGAL